MNKIACPELCDNCPLAELVPLTPRELEQSEKFVAFPDISPKGDRVSIDFEHGRPVGRHLVEVGLVPEVGGDGIGFWVDSSLGLNGAARAFEGCDGPKNKRTGFLKLGKKAVCGAVLKFAKEL